MTHEDRFEYEVAISFADEDRAIAEQLASLLTARNKNVLLDDFQPAQLGGSDFLTHIAELYRTKARFCVMLISQHYPLKKWTAAERSAAQEHALRDAEKYLVPIRLDDVQVPGVTESEGYWDLRQSPMKGIVDLLEQKLEDIKREPGPPSKSHDLRSGNIPSSQGRSENERES